MFATAWKNGRQNEFTGSGYGIRVGKRERDKYFDRSWKSVFIDIGGTGNWREFKIRNTFWGNCSEFRSAAIGKYLIENDFGDWVKGVPPALDFFPQDGNRFILMASAVERMGSLYGDEIFHYSGNVEIGTAILYGYKKLAAISRKEYRELLKIFSGRSIRLGSERDIDKGNDLQDWIEENITGDNIAIYVAGILVEEGYAIVNDGPDIKEIVIRDRAKKKAGHVNRNE